MASGLAESRVGPHGYIHGWIHVGPGGLPASHGLKAGDRVRAQHPIHGEVEGHVTGVGSGGRITATLHSPEGGEVPNVGIHPGSVTHVGKEAAGRTGAAGKMGEFGGLRDEILQLKKDLANSGRLGPNGMPVATGDAVKALGNASYAITSGNAKDARQHLMSAFAYLARVDRGSPLLARIKDAISKYDALSRGKRTAETPVASTVHEPFGSPAGPGLFHVKGLQLPAYVQHVAHHLVAQGHPESKAIQMAIGIVKNWAAGHDGHGNRVHPDVQAAAAKAVAEWEADKAAAHGGKRFNPFHLPAGAGGGEFTSAGHGGGGGKAKTPAASSAKAPAPVKGGKAGESRAERKQRFLTQAKADRAKAHELQHELAGLEKQAKQSHAKTVAAAKKAAHHQKINPHAKHQAPGHGKHHHQHHHQSHAKKLRQQITGLRQQIRQLLTQAASLEAQARAL